MCLKIWYMSLKPAIDIHNIMYTGYVHVNPISPFASITQKKTGLNCGSMTCPTGGAPNINYGKNNYGKNGQSALAP